MTKAPVPMRSVTARYPADEDGIINIPALPEEGSPGGKETIRLTRRSWLVPIQMGEVMLMLAVDTGSERTIISYEVYQRYLSDKPLQPSERKFCTADGEDLTTYGQFQGNIQIGVVRVTGISITVANVLGDGLLGMDYLAAADALIGARDGKLYMRSGDHIVSCQMRSEGEFVRRVARPLNRVSVAPMTVGMIRCVVDPPYKEEERQTGAGMVADVVWCKTTNVRVPSALVPASDEITLPMANYSVNAVTVTENQTLALLQEATECSIAVGELLVERVRVAAVSEPKDDERPRPPRELPEFLTDLRDGCIKDSMQPGEDDVITELLTEFADVFMGPDGELGTTTEAEHTIDTGERPPVKQRPYRMSSEGHSIVEQECEKMLEKGVIRESKSPWSSPVVLVAKKSGEVRFCVDYRRLNSMTVKDSYPLPNIEDTLGALGGCKYFCTMDLASGFWQVPMKEEDKCKTAFSTRTGLYEFNTMPFGLCNAPATFERVMERVLQGLAWRICLVYVDDIVVGGPTVAETVRRLGLVWTRLRDAGLKLKPAKCDLFRASVTFLGHVISEEGVDTDPEKITALTGRDRPASLHWKTYALS